MFVLQCDTSLEWQKKVLVSVHITLRQSLALELMFSVCLLKAIPLSKVTPRGVRLLLHGIGILFTATKIEIEAASRQFTVDQSNSRQASRAWRPQIEVATTEYFWF